MNLDYFKVLKQQVELYDVWDHITMTVMVDPDIINEIPADMIVMEEVKQDSVGYSMTTVEYENTTYFLVGVGEWKGTRCNLIVSACANTMPLRAPFAVIKI